MALKQTTSRQLMDLTEDIYNRVKSIENNSMIMQENLKKRLSVIRNIQEFEVQRMSELENAISDGKWTEQSSKIVFARSEVVDGIYDKFGISVHPKFLKTPTDVFNFKTAEGYSFKDNGIVTINGVAEPEYLGALSHDSISGKDICFGEFNTPAIDFRVTVNPGELLGSTEFNCIEILPYIPGSFDIQNVSIYSLQGYYTGSMTYDDRPVSNTIYNVGATRIMLESAINLYEVRMSLALRFQNSNGRYPFGIKHIYFLNASFDPNSYIVVKVPQTKNINTISEGVTVKDQTGNVTSSCKQEGLELFCDYDSGVGIDSIATSKGLTNNPITRNIKAFFVKYPLFRVTTSLKFDSITLRG